MFWVGVRAVESVNTKSGVRRGESCRVACQSRRAVSQALPVMST